MLSLHELQRAVLLLEKSLSGARLRRLVQLDQYKLILSFDRPPNRQHILVSCRPEFARICAIAYLPPRPLHDCSFFEFLQAHLLGSSVAGIEVAGEDRQVRILLQVRSSIFVLILSILGARSNLYILDAAGKLLHSMRPLDKTRRELKLGESWTNPRGRVRDAGSDRWRNVPDDEYLEAIEKTYQRLERRHEADLSARQIETVLAKERVFLDRKAINLQEDLGRAQQAETYRRKGELLKNVLHTIKSGDDKVMALDLETGESVEIPLDPKIAPAANLKSYFTRYQKESRGVTLIQQQLEDLRVSQIELEGLEEQLNQVLKNEDLDLEVLANIKSQPRVRRLINRYSPLRKSGATRAKPHRKRQVPSRLLPKRYRTEDGLEIWVGRSDEGNDYLTTRLARGNDLFFHLEGYPGSHIILRTEGRLDPPSKSLLDACELAVHFSKMKNAGVADVHVAPVKEVKKPKGAKAGLVYVRRGKTIHLRRDPKRLQNILAARLDE